MGKDVSQPRLVLLLLRFNFATKINHPLALGTFLGTPPEGWN